jgi:hypothetical protein
MRRKGVTDMITAGRTDNNVSMTTICRGALKLAEPLEGFSDMPGSGF